MAAIEIVMIKGRAIYKGSSIIIKLQFFTNQFLRRLIVSNIGLAYEWFYGFDSTFIEKGTTQSAVNPIGSTNAAVIFRQILVGLMRIFFRKRKDLTIVVDSWEMDVQAHIIVRELQ